MSISPVSGSLPLTAFSVPSPMSFFILHLLVKMNPIHRHNIERRWRRKIRRRSRTRRTTHLGMMRHQLHRCPMRRSWHRASLRIHISIPRCRAPSTRRAQLSLTLIPITQKPARHAARQRKRNVRRRRIRRIQVYLRLGPRERVRRVRFVQLAYVFLVAQRPDTFGTRVATAAGTTGVNRCLRSSPLLLDDARGCSEVQGRFTGGSVEGLQRFQGGRSL